MGTEGKLLLGAQPGRLQSVLPTMHGGHMHSIHCFCMAAAARKVSVCLVNPNYKMRIARLSDLVKGWQSSSKVQDENIHG